jgi:hypothetical protein
MMKITSGFFGYPLITIAFVTLILFSKLALSRGEIPQENKLMIEIEDKIKQVFKDEGGYVGIVSVSESKTIRPNTRGEMAVIHIKVNNSIYGNIGETSLLTIYTKNSQAPLLVDHKYLVVLKDVELFRPRFWLEAFQVLDCQNCINIVSQCEELIYQ